MVTILAFEEAMPNELGGQAGQLVGAVLALRSRHAGEAGLLLADNARALAEMERC